MVCFKYMGSGLRGRKGGGGAGGRGSVDSTGDHRPYAQGLGMEVKLPCRIFPALHCLLICITLIYLLNINIDIHIIQFICILESQVVECSMGSFYTQRL